MEKTKTEEKGQHWRQYGIAIIATFGVVCLGYSSSWMSPAQGKLEDVEQSPLPEPVTRDEVSRIGSLLTVGAVIGPFIGGFAASRLGRKWGIMLGAVPLFVGWILLATARNVYEIYAARILFGIAIGIIFTIVPMYNGEIAEKEVRGALGSFLSVAITTGNLIGYSVGPFVSYSGMAYVGVCLSAVFVMSFYLMPESPHFYMIKGDRESAQESLMFIRAKSDNGVQVELNRLESDIASGPAVKTKLSNLWANRGNIKALYICGGLLALQPFTGVTAISLYTESIFRAANMEMDPAISAILLAVVEVLASLIAPLIVDRLGRRILLKVSSLGVVVALAVLGVYFLLEHNGNPVASSIGFVPILATVLYTIFYSIGIGPIPWALVGELFAVNVKTVATPLVNTIHWGMSFIVARYFFTVVDNLGMHYAFWIFSATTIIVFFFALIFIPETKGKSYQEIQDILNGRKSLAVDDEVAGYEKRRPALEESETVQGGDGGALRV